MYVRYTARKVQKKERSGRGESLVKRAKSISGNIHHCVCHELCEGGVCACVSKKVKTNPLHLLDGVSAEASESIGGDSLYKAVLVQVTMQHKDQHIKDKQQILRNKWYK